MTHVTRISYKSSKVKYSQHHSLICKLQCVVFCHFRLCSLWDKGPSCHSGCQQHLSMLLSMLEVAAAWCPRTGRTPGPWRRAALGHTAEMSPCLMRQEVRGAVFNFGDPCAWGSPKAGLCHLAKLLWTWGWVWPLLLCKILVLRHSSIFKLTCTYLADVWAKLQSLPGCGTKE